MSSFNTVLNIKANTQGLQQGVSLTQNLLKSLVGGADQANQQMSRSTRVALEQAQQKVVRLRAELDRLNRITTQGPSNISGLRSTRDSLADQLNAYGPALQKARAEYKRFTDERMASERRLAQAAEAYQNAPNKRAARGPLLQAQRELTAATQAERAAKTSLLAVEAQYSQAITREQFALDKLNRTIAANSRHTQAGRDAIARATAEYNREMQESRRLETSLLTAQNRLEQEERELATATKQVVTVTNQLNAAEGQLARTSARAADQRSKAARSTRQLKNEEDQLAGASSRAAAQQDRVTRSTRNAARAANDGRAAYAGFGATVGTHVGGLAVRLQGAEIGLAAIGTGLTMVASRGRQFLAGAIQSTADFEKSLLTIDAIMGNQFSGSMEDIRQLTLGLGRDTVFTSEEAAQAVEILVKAGIDWTDVSGGAARATLDLAAATGTDLKQAAEVATTAMNIFGYSGDQLEHVADVVTKAVNASKIEAKDFAESLKNMGPVAKQLGIPFEEVAKYVAVLGNLGIKAGPAGTALRYFWLNMVPRTGSAFRAMERLGLLSINNAEALEVMTKAGVKGAPVIDNLWTVFARGEKINKDLSKASEADIFKFERWAAARGVVQSVFLDEQGKLKDAATVIRTLYEAVKDIPSGNRLAALAEIFKERGGAKGAAPFVQMFEDMEKAAEEAGVAVGDIFDQMSVDMERAGGAAQVQEQIMSGLAGRLEFFRGSWDALVKTLGAPFQEPLAKTVNMVAELVNGLTQAAAQNPEMARLVGTLGGMLTVIASVAGPLTLFMAAWPYLSGALAGTLVAALPVVGVLTALALAASAVYQAMADPTVGLAGAVAEALPTLQALGEQARTMAEDVFQGFLIPAGRELAKLFVSEVIPRLVTLASWLGDFLPRAAAALGDAWNTVLVPALRLGWVIISRYLWPAVANFANLIKDNLNPIMRIGAALMVAWAARTAIAGVVSMLTAARVRALAVWQGVAAVATMGFSKAMAVLRVMMALGNGAIALFTGRAMLMSRAIRIAEAAGKGLALVQGIVAGGFKALLRALGPIGIAITLITVGVELLKSAWENNFLGIRDIVQGAVNFIVEKFGWLGKALGFLGDVVGKIFGFFDDGAGAAEDAADRMGEAFNQVPADLRSSQSGIDTAMGDIASSFDVSDKTGAYGTDAANFFAGISGEGGIAGTLGDEATVAAIDSANKELIASLGSEGAQTASAQAGTAVGSMYVAGGSPNGVVPTLQAGKPAVEKAVTDNVVAPLASDSVKQAAATQGAAVAQANIDGFVQTAKDKKDEPANALRTQTEPMQRTLPPAYQRVGDDCALGFYSGVEGGIKRQGPTVSAGVAPVVGDALKAGGVQDAATSAGEVDADCYVGDSSKGLLGKLALSAPTLSATAVALVNALYQPGVANGVGYNTGSAFIDGLLSALQGLSPEMRQAVVSGIPRPGKISQSTLNKMASVAGVSPIGPRKSGTPDPYALPGPSTRKYGQGPGYGGSTDRSYPPGFGPSVPAQPPLSRTVRPRPGMRNVDDRRPGASRSQEDTLIRLPGGGTQGGKKTPRAIPTTPSTPSVTVTSEGDGGIPYDTPGVGDAGGGGGGATKTKAEAAADVLKNISDAIKGAVEAFKLLSKLEIPTNLEEKAQQFTKAGAMLVMAFQSVAKMFSDEALEHVSNYAESQGKVANALSAVTDFFEKVQKLDVDLNGVMPKVVDIVKRAHIMMNVLGSLIGGSKDGPGWSPENVALVGDFADAGGKVTGFLSAFVDFIAKLNAPKFEIKPVVAKIEQLALQATLMMDILGSLLSGKSGWTDENIAKVGTFSEAGQKVAQFLGAFVDFQQKLLSPKVSMGPVVDKVRTLALQATLMMDILGGLLSDKTGWTEENIAKVGSFAETGAKVADSLVKTVDALAAIAKSKVNPDEMAGAISRLILRLRETVENVRNLIDEELWASEDSPSKGIQAWADTGVKSAEALVKMVEALNATADSKVDPATMGERISRVIVSIRDTVDNIINLIDEGLWGSTDGSPSPGVQAFADTGAKVADLIIKGLDSLERLASKAKRGTSADAGVVLRAVIEIVRQFRDDLASYGVSLSDESLEIEQRTGAVAESAGKVVGLVGSTLDALEKLAGGKAIFKRNPTQYVGPVVAAIGTIVRAIKDAAPELQSYVDQIDDELPAKLSSVISSVGGVFDIFEKLVGFTGVSEARIVTFREAVIRLVRQIPAIATAIAPELMDAAKEAGEKLAPALSLLSQALDIFKGITGEVDEDGKRKGGLLTVDPAAIGELTGKLWLLLTTLKRDLLDTGLVELLQDTATEFAEKVGPSIAVLKDALDLFKGITGDEEGKGKLQTVDPDAIGALVGNLYTLLHHWNNLIIGGEFQGDFAERSAAFADTVRLVLTAIADAVALARQIEEAGGVDKVLGTIGALAASMNSAASADLQGVGQSFGQFFLGLRDVFTQGTDPENPESAAYIWQAKDPKKGFLHRLWFAVEGKNGIRWWIYYAFNGMFTDLLTLFEQWGGQITAFWKKNVLDVMKSDTRAAIDEIKAMFGELAVPQVPGGNPGNPGGNGGNPGGGNGGSPGGGNQKTDSTSTNTNIYNIRSAFIQPKVSTRGVSNRQNYLAWDPS